MIVRSLVLSTLLLTTICEAREQPDLISTTTNALTKQYSTELGQVTKTIEKKGNQILTKLGINREYATSTVLFTKMLLEQKVEYRHVLESKAILGGRSTDNFAGIMIYLTSEF